MPKYRLAAISIAIGLAAASAPAHAWGPLGHRITGAIAQENLSGTARAHVQLLLGSEDLAEAATWPDDMKSNPDPYWQKKANPWHYITAHGDHYHASDAPPEGDAITALADFTKVLQDGNAPLEERRKALRFIVHIIGDLHQPLHAGAGNDRGGNLVQVTWFGRNTNLHSLWDSSLIEHRQLSYSEYSNWLMRAMKPEQIVSWNDRRPATWTSESIALRKTIYPANPSLSWDYAYQFRGTVDDRLSRAGVRIAAYLNALFDLPQPK